MITEDKVYLPESIKSTPFPNEIEGSAKEGSTVTNKKVYQPELSLFTGFPVSKIVDNVIGISLDTQSRRIKGEFSFDSLGSISIGNYSSGVSGDVKISPNGIVARNSAGDTTFSLDGTTGDATFKGTVASGSVVTGYVQVGGALADVGSGNITGTYIANGSITSGKISVSTLSSITANIGTITAGTINGATITGTTSISIGYVYMLGNGLIIQDNKYLVLTDTAGNQDGVIYMNTSNRLNVLNTGGKTALGSTSDDVILLAHNAEVLVGDSDGHIQVNDPIIVGGVEKSAIVPVKDGYRALYCMESPEVWFMDITDSKDLIDPIFAEVTVGEKKFIKTEDGSYLVFARRKGHEHRRFETRTEREYNNNNKFWSTPFR